MPSHLKSNKVKDDREFQWLLCLASALTASQHQQPPEALRTPGFAGTANRKLSERKLKKAFDLALKKL
jgi:hypothetical protein